MNARIQTVQGMQRPIRREEGFTLIELLVVILIIGILAAIAIPSFLNQRTKGQDACAKSQVKTMQTAMETYYTDHNSYSGATLGALGQIESAVVSTGACGTGTLALATGMVPGDCDFSSDPEPDAYCVIQSSAATSGGTRHNFGIRKSASGQIARYCVPAGEGGCSQSNSW